MKAKADFEDLRIWQEGHQLMLIVQGIANKLPKNVEFERISQVKRSSSSVADNIAEGYCSFYYNEKIKGVMTARKEAGETQNHIKAIAAKGYISKEMEEELVDRYQGLIKGINAYVKYICEKRDREKKKKHRSS